MSLLEILVCTHLYFGIVHYFGVGGVSLRIAKMLLEVRANFHTI